MKQSEIKPGTDGVSFDLEFSTSIADTETPDHGAYFVTVARLKDTAANHPVPADIENAMRVVWLGSGFFERMQQHGFAETRLQSRFGGRKVTFRDLAWSGDDVWGTARAVFDNQANGFARLQKDLKDSKPDIVIVNYGVNGASDSNISVQLITDRVLRTTVPDPF